MHNVVIILHVVGASLALTLGAWQLVRRARGDRPHRRVGRLWVALMYWTVLSSFAIHDLDPGHFSWIHGLSVFTFVTLTIGTVAAVRGNIETHRRFMTGSYYGLVGAFLGAVVVPQRAVPQLAVDRPLVFGAAVLGVAVASVVLVELYGGSRPDPTCRPPTCGTVVHRTASNQPGGAG